jgi:hypothetical protein
LGRFLPAVKVECTCRSTFITSKERVHIPTRSRTSQLRLPVESYSPIADVCPLEQNARHLQPDRAVFQGLLATDTDDFCIVSLRTPARADRELADKIKKIKKIRRPSACDDRF